MSKQDIKKRAEHRIKIIAGQINGVLRAIEDDKYCIDILNQSLAIQESLKSLDALLLENHINTCVKDNINKKDEGEKTIKELIRLYKISRKNN